MDSKKSFFSFPRSSVNAIKLSQGEQIRPNSPEYVSRRKGEHAGSPLQFNFFQ
ncbi:MAG: hypothetical protein KAI83_07735 [Thiomargarita sp.]|nr:hypothetical protein [Thiomargarita sp.]